MCKQCKTQVVKDRMHVHVIKIPKQKTMKDITSFHKPEIFSIHIIHCHRLGEET